jgi:DNA-binding NarL/FixJ family response regulator
MYSILIIEDDSSYRSMMALVLQMEGFDVRAAADGQTGFSLLREKRPNLILCDIMMPGMNGHSVLDAVKRDKMLANIPFVFVTALAERADVRRGMSAGADDYLPKPFSAGELLDAVSSRIHRHEIISSQHRELPFQEEQTILSTKITRREREVLLMVGQGATTRAIAKQLGVSLKTAEAHRANLMNKLDVPNAASLARWAVVAEQM